MRRADATQRLLAVQVCSSRPELGAALDDPSPEVARAAIRRLAEIDGLGAALALLQTASVLLDDPEPVIRRLTTDDEPAVHGAAKLWLLRASGPYGTGRGRPGRDPARRHDPSRR